MTEMLNPVGSGRRDTGEVQVPISLCSFAWFLPLLTTYNLLCTSRSASTPASPYLDLPLDTFVHIRAEVTCLFQMISACHVIPVDWSRAEGGQGDCL